MWCLMYRPKLKSHLTWRIPRNEQRLTTWAKIFPLSKLLQTKLRRGKGTSGHQKIRPLLLQTLFSILQLLPCLFWEGLCTVVVQLNILEMTDTCSDTSSKKTCLGQVQASCHGARDLLCFPLFLLERLQDNLSHLVTTNSPCQDWHLQHWISPEFSRRPGIS